jgi:hypothetical protein
LLRPPQALIECATVLHRCGTQIVAPRTPIGQKEKPEVRVPRYPRVCRRNRSERVVALQRVLSHTVAEKLIQTCSEGSIAIRRGLVLSREAFYVERRSIATAGAR